MASLSLIPSILINLSILCSAASDLDANDPEIKSSEMMRLLRNELNCWRTEKSASEKNAFDGIQKLMQINSSHPIREALFLVYFVKKSDFDHVKLTFGTKLVRWPYHCCIGFKDSYLDKDFLIDIYVILLSNIRWP